MKTKFLLPIFLAIASVSISLADEPSVKEHPQISVNVRGEVKTPSLVTLPIGSTVVDALAAVGNATGIANLRKLRMFHKTDAHESKGINIDVTEILNGKSPNVVLQDGDTIILPAGAFSLMY